MFRRHTRYVTRRANEVLTPEIEATLWDIIDRDLSDRTKLDYLQVFSLTIVQSGSVMYQRIRQKQEHLKRVNVYDVSGIEEPVSGVTVWIIDNGDYCTMLLPEDC